MSFALGFLVYVVGSVLIGVCLLAIPGRGGEPPPSGHDGHGHGHGAH